MKKIALMLILAMTTASFAGCGSTKSTSETTDTATTDSVESTETAETTEATTSEQSEALADGVLSVGTNAEFPPFEFVGDNGEPDGFDIALMKAIGEKLGVEVQVDNMEFDSLVASIGTKVDVAASGMTITEERQQMVDFSDTYYEAIQYVIVLKDAAIATSDDLVGKNIGVQLGTTGDFIAEDIEGATVSTYNKAVDAVNDMINGRVDCVIIDKNPALVFGEKFADQVEVKDGADFGFETENYGIAMPKGDTALVSAVNEALAELKTDGTFDKLVTEYIEE